MVVKNTVQWKKTHVGSKMWPCLNSSCTLKLVIWFWYSATLSGSFFQPFPAWFFTYTWSTMSHILSWHNIEMQISWVTFFFVREILSFIPPMFIIFIFSWTESSLCAMPVFDVITMLITCSVLPCYMNRAYASSLMWAQKSVYIFTQNISNLWSHSKTAYSRRSLTHHDLVSCCVKCTFGIWLLPSWSVTDISYYMFPWVNIESLFLPLMCGGNYLGE
jgi:hypothetical protein